MPLPLEEQVALILKGDPGEKPKFWEAVLRKLVTLLPRADRDALACISGQFAVAARDPSWREVIGKSGLLSFLLDTVPVYYDGVFQGSHPLNKQALRVVGNACVDNDENRKVVVASGKLTNMLKMFLSEDHLLPFAVITMLNVCVDYSSAQLQVSNAALSKVLIDLISGERLRACEAHLTQIMTVLELLTNHASEFKICYPRTPAALLTLAINKENRLSSPLDREIFLSICTSALSYLVNRGLQVFFIQNKHFSLLQEAFLQSYIRFETAGEDVEEETKEQLKQVQHGFVTLFADITDVEGFGDVYGIDSEEVGTLVGWLELEKFPQLQNAACLALGNLGRSDESTKKLLPRVGEGVVKILGRSVPGKVRQGERPSLQLTHAALGFTKNLAIPAANKPVLGEMLLKSGTLAGLWEGFGNSQPSMMFAAVSLGRLLLVGCRENVRLVCKPVSIASDEKDENGLASAESSSQGETATYRTNLDLLYRSATGSPNEDPTKLEAARVVVSAVCRVLSQDPGVLGSSGELEEFYKTHSDIIAGSFTTMLTQAKWPSVRSDAITVLALMASQHPEGSNMVLKVVEDTAAEEGVLKAIVKAATGDDEMVGKFLGTGDNRVEEIEEEKQGKNDEEKETKEVTELVQGLGLEPQQADAQAQKQPERMVKVDRENALVLMAMLLGMFKDQMSPARRRLVEAVLERGGELVVKDREGTSQV